MKFRFTVTIDLRDLSHNPSGIFEDPPCLSKRAVKTIFEGYIRDALTSWGYRLRPGDVSFPANIRKVTVRGEKVE